MTDENKKVAKLKTFMFAQDYSPEHWDWDPSELKSLGNPGDMANVILRRLQAAELEVTEAYAIEHDKDEHELWNEYENQYQVKIAETHIQVVCKLATGETLENIAKFIGISPNFIAKPKTGRYSYDNMLAYLIHIKYPSKYQYKPDDVITIAGKEYIKHFSESYSRWMHGRAVRILRDAEYDLKDLLVLIAEGKIYKRDLPYSKYETLYAMHRSRINKALSDRLEVEHARELLVEDNQEYLKQQRLKQQKLEQQKLKRQKRTAN